MPKRWTPRSSSLGNYFSCLQRAAFDRALHQGMLTAEDLGLEEGCDDTKYADFGSRVHHLWQLQVASEFGTPDRDAKTVAEQWEAASRLFADDVDAAKEAARAAADCAAATMREAGLPGPEDWIAELDCKPKGLALTGHIDLVTRKGDMLIDLKTTSRKPDHNRVKPAHLYQIAAYALMLEQMGMKPQMAYVLYIESIRARWAVLCEINVQDEMFQDLMEHCRNLLKFLRSAQLFKLAKPSLGTHCQTQFCPYVSICRDRYLPGPGEVYGDTSPKKTITAKMGTEL